MLVANMLLWLHNVVALSAEDIDVVYGNTPIFMQSLLTFCQRQSPPLSYSTIFPVSDIYVYLCLLEVIKVIHFEIYSEEKV